MRKYRFRLEPVLRVRTMQEDLARAALAQANHRVVSAEAVVAARLSHYSSMALANGVRSQSEFMRTRFSHEMAARSVREAEAARRQAEEEAAARREAWTEAAKEVQVLERLDERRRAEHALEAARQADAEVDDIVVGRFGRTQADQGRDNR